MYAIRSYYGRELAPEGIRVNAIAPGTVDNDFTKGRTAKGNPKGEVIGEQWPKPSYNFV